MLPVILFLGMRPSPLPNTAYLQTIILHKWVSRLVVVTGLVHGGAFLVYFIREHKFSHTFKFDNFLGVIILIMMLTMGITSLKPIRRRFYGFFYYIHYPFAWLTVILGCIHARPGVSLLTFWCVLVLVSQIVYRIMNSKRVQIEEHSITPTLKLITLPRSVVPDYFLIGSHVRLSKPLTSPLTWVTPSHPYTIASHPSDDSVKLLVREFKYQLVSNENCSLTGPFPTVSSSLFNSAKKVLIFAGGSGLSFGAAVYRGLQINATAEVKLIWMIRSKAEIAALELLEIDAADVFVTGRIRALAAPSGGDSDFELEDLLDEEEDEVNDASESHFVGNSSAEGESPNSPSLSEPEFDQKDSSRIRIHKGRPDLRNEAMEYFSEADLKDSGSWVIACGPEGLVKEIRRWSRKQPNIQFHGEKYVM